METKVVIIIAVSIIKGHSWMRCVFLIGGMDTPEDLCFMLSAQFYLVRIDDSETPREDAINPETADGDVELALDEERSALLAL